METKRKELVEKLNAKNGDVNAIHDAADANTKGGEPQYTGEQIAKLESLEKELGAIESELRGLDALQKSRDLRKSREEYLNDPVGRPAIEGTKGKVGESEIDLLTGQIVKEKGAGALTNEQILMIHNPEFCEGFKSWMRASGDEYKMRGSKSATDAFLSGRDDEGALFVPPQLIAGIIKRDPAPTRIVDFVRTLAISSGQAQMVKSNYNTDNLYSSAVRIFKTGEASAAKKSDKPQFGLLKIDVHGWTGLVTVSRQHLADTNFDIMGYLANEFRTACRNLTADKMLNGTGVDEHFGMLTNKRAGTDKGPRIVKSGDANGLTWDSLRKCKNQLPEQYDMNARWVFNKKSTLDTIEGFKDKNDRDLWPESQRAGGENGAPGTLRGYGYGLEAFMPDIAPGKRPILHGDFTGYARVFRAGMTIQVLKEIAALDGQVVFLVEYREGGDVIEPWKLSALEIGA